MNIPPLLNPLTHEGYYELNFTPLFNPTVLIYDKNEARPSKLSDDSKGVFVIVDTQERDGYFYVYVGHSGVGESKQTFFDRLIRIYNKDEGLSDEINDTWDKAILIFDWDNEIEIDRQSDHIKNRRKIDKAMEMEVIHLRDRLRYEINATDNLHLTSESEGENYFMPNPDSRRYKYYVNVVMQLLRKLTEDNIDLSGSNE